MAITRRCWAMFFHISSRSLCRRWKKWQKSEKSNLAKNPPAPGSITISPVSGWPLIVRLVGTAPTSAAVSVILLDSALLLTVRVVGTALTSFAVSVMLLDSALLLMVRLVGTAPTSAAVGICTNLPPLLRPATPFVAFLAVVGTAPTSDADSDMLLDSALPLTVRDRGTVLLSMLANAPLKSVIATVSDSCHCGRL